MAIKGNRIGDTQLFSVLNQLLLPPSATYNIQMNSRHHGPQFCDSLKRMLNLLMRH